MSIINYNLLLFYSSERIKDFWRIFYDPYHLLIFLRFTELLRPSSEILFFSQQFPISLEIKGFFELFRFFDIIKPWPIRWADKKVSGGFGIMLDDIIAGMFAWLSLFLFNYLFFLIYLSLKFFSRDLWLRFGLEIL